MVKKPDLDEATQRIARRILSTPPKPHDEMKLGKPKGKPIPKKSRRGRASSKG
jgi:hypothetical protein